MTKIEMVNAMSSELKGFGESKKYALKQSTRRVKEVYDYYEKEKSNGKINIKRLQSFCMAVI